MIGMQGLEKELNFKKKLNKPAKRKDLVSILLFTTRFFNSSNLLVGNVNREVYALLGD
jgi:hypothetical protein